ncbi:hypothetical protein [Enterococcus sp. N249-2]
MNQGYVKLYRKVTSSFVWANPNMLKLWLLCLVKASHKESRFVFNGQEVYVSSGQFVTGRAIIEKEFNGGVPRDQQIVGRTLWRWLKKFEKEEMLSIKSTTKYSVISIKNWDEYQSSDQQVSSGRPSTVQQVSTYKNDKNDKNEKNNNIVSKKLKKRIYPENDSNKKLAVLLFRKISQNQNIKEPDLNSWANTIRLMIESDKRAGKEVQDMIVWATQDDFWKGVILSAASLRKNFDKLNAQKNRQPSNNKIVREEKLPDWAQGEVQEAQISPERQAEIDKKLAAYLNKTKRSERK